MDLATLLEIVKVGGPILGICIVLLYATLRDKDRMARELNADKRLMLEAFNRNTVAFSNFANQLEKRKCMTGMRYNTQGEDVGLHG